MLKKQCAVLVISRVIQALSVRSELYSHITSSRQLILERLPGLHIEQVNDIFVRSAFLEAVREQGTISRNILDRNRSVGIAAHRRGIHQSFIFSRPPMPHVNGELLLPGEAAHKKITPGALTGRGGIRYVLQGIEIVDDLIT